MSAYVARHALHTGGTVSLLPLRTALVVVVQEHSLHGVPSVRPVRITPEGRVTNY